MARIRGRAGYRSKTFNKTEVLQWLKTLPVAPEFHPTLEEFQDPIAYIQKIEKEASSYGICKIIPPMSLPSKKTTILELNKSFLACSGSQEGELRPAFTTRVQQVGFCPRKDHHVTRSVRESGQSYTLSEFEAKAKAFEKNHFKDSSIVKGMLSPLELETLYWDAQADKAIDVEYGNDMPCSAFIELNKRRGGEGLSERMNVGDSDWNVRGVARAKGCLLGFVKDEIPGVTSPMVYMGMMFSWFAWHVEDHDFHSLNYMHMGDAKTWYGVPSDAAIAFEEVIRSQGYGGQRDVISTYETLAQKTTVMSPELILNAGIPCCRLVQNAGEFVVTFPRAYHSGFSHGFNCAEASNIATPEWLKFARKAAIRRASINFPPLVSHNQLLYNIALSSSSSVPMSIEPRSSRLKERKKGDGEDLVKELFVKDVVRNTNLLHILGKGSPAILLPLDFIEGKFSRLRDGNTIPLYGKHIHLSCTAILKKHKMFSEENLPAQWERLANTGIFSCVTCGVLCFACAAIVRPSEVAAHNLMSYDCDNVEGKAVASEVAARDAKILGRIMARSCNYLFDVPASCSRPPKDTSSLSLLALTYGDSSDSDTESGKFSPVYGLDSDDSRSSHSLSFPVVSPIEITNSQSSDTSYIPGMVLPHVTATSSSVANHTESAISGALVPVQNRGTLFPKNSDDDSSRSHVFCLQHAFEVEQKLRALGGVHMLLLCHPDYPQFQAEAKRMADDLGTDHLCSNIDFREATEEDWESFNSGLNSEGSVHGNADWTVKLGVNICYVMSNQIHHLLAEGVHDEEEKVYVPHTLAKQQVQEPDAIPENLSGSQTIDMSTEISKSILKRKTGTAEESLKAADHAAKNEGIIVFERRKKLKEKVIREETPRHEKDQDQGAEQFGINNEEKPEGGPSTRLRQRTGKEPTKNELKLVKDKAVTRSAKKAKRTPGIQASAVNRAKKSEETEYACKIDSCTMNFGSKKELAQHEKDRDQGAELFGINNEEKMEGGPSTRLRQRTGKEPAKNELNVVKDKVVTRSAKRTKRTPGIQASAVKRAKKSEETEYACKIDSCTMNFGSKKELMQHEKNICSVKDCGQKFGSHKYLLQHRRVHIDDRPLKCPWTGCTKTFKWAWARTEHVRVHTGERPYTCGETGCGQTFRFLSDFSRHKRKSGHSGKGRTE